MEGAGTRAEGGYTDPILGTLEGGVRRGGYEIDGNFVAHAAIKYCINPTKSGFFQTQIFGAVCKRPPPPPYQTPPTPP